MRKTKAELIEELKKEQERNKKLDRRVEADTAFKQTKEEKEAKDKAQNLKDFYKRATNGRYVNKEQFEQYIEKQRQVRGY